MRPIFSKPVIASLILCSLAAAVLVALLVREIQDPAVSNPNNNHSHQNNDIVISQNIGDAFTLINGSGQEVHDYYYRGQYLLIYFGFSYCPDVCPTALLRISDALDTLEETHPTLAQNIQPLFISVDPERDTPDAIRAYVRHFHPRLEGLTGSAAQIDKVKRSFKIYAAKVKDETSPDGYTIDHSSIIYLMDKQNRFLAHFTDNQTSDDIATKIKTLIAK